MKKRKLLLSSSVSRAIIIAGLTLSMSVSPVAVYASEDTSETVSGQDTADADSMENAGEAETDNTGEDSTDPSAAWLNSDILGEVTADTQVSAKDDFASYANQEWLSTAQIPDGYSDYNAFAECEDLLKERKMALIGNSEITDHNEELVTDLYKIAMNWDRRNEVGLDELKPYLETIDQIETIDDLTNYLTDSEENLTGNTLFNLSLSVESQNSSRYCASISEMPVLYPYSDDYEELSVYGEMVDYTNRKIAVYMLGRLGWTEEDANSFYDSVIDFERTVASYEYTEEEVDSPDIVQMATNEYSFEELKSQVSVFPIGEFLQDVNNADTIVFNVENPRMFELWDQIYTEENLENIKNYLYMNVILYCPFKFDREAYEYVNNIYNEVDGTTGMLSGEDYGYTAVNNALPFVLDYLYMDQWCTEEMRNDVLDMIENFKGYYEKMLQEEDWLSQETKERAIEKLQALRAEALYPDKRYDYSELSLHDLVEDGTYFQAIRRIEEFESDRVMEKLGTEVDPDYWDVQTSSCNAYYNPGNNSIIILAGLLVPPMYSEDMNYEEKLAIYSTIGHEITHAFDSTGAQYDKDGNLNMWWTDQDYIEFQNRADSVVRYLDRIVPDKQQEAVNGNRVQEEMVADLGSLKATLALAAAEPDFDYDAFFRAYALQWRMVSSLAVQQQSMGTDEHPLNYLRTNVVLQQFQEFYDTYGVEPGDGMYLAPEERLSVW